MKNYNKKFIFTVIDKQIFADILHKYRHVVASKKIDGATIRAKNVAWGKIAAEFNSNPHTSQQVSPKQLRRLWMNLKQRHREAWKKGRFYRTSGAGQLNAVYAGIERIDAVFAGIEQADAVYAGVEQYDTAYAGVEQYETTYAGFEQDDSDSSQPSMPQPIMLVDVDIPPDDPNTNSKTETVYSVESPLESRPGQIPTQPANPAAFSWHRNQTRPERDGLSQESVEESHSVKTEEPNPIETEEDTQLLTQSYTSSSQGAGLKCKTTESEDLIQSTADSEYVRLRTPTNIASSPRSTHTHRTRERTASRESSPELQPTEPTDPTKQNDVHYLKHKKIIMEKEFRANQKRARELHNIELMLMRERLREAKAKADLAELLLEQQKEKTSLQSAPTVVKIERLE